MSQGVYQASVDKRLHEAYKANKPTNLVAPATYTNAAMKAPYTGNNMISPRDGANDRAHASLPMGAQIQVSQKQKPQAAPTV